MNAEKQEGAENGGTDRADEAHQRIGEKEQGGRSDGGRKGGAGKAPAGVFDEIPCEFPGAAGKYRDSMNSFAF